MKVIFCEFRLTHILNIIVKNLCIASKSNICNMIKTSSQRILCLSLAIKI